MVSIVNNSPFESKYGFRGKNFSVDTEGNIIATSITLTETNDTNELPADFTVTESTNNFIINSETNPTITISRGSKVIFDLSLTSLDFNIYSNETLYNIGLSHTDGTTGANAQEKSNGRLILNVVSTTPDTLQYKSSQSSIYYTINVVDEDASFNNLQINSQSNTTVVGEGALKVTGGASIAKNLVVGENLYTTEIKSNTNLILDVADGIVVLSTDSSVLGSITDEGSSIPLVNTTIENTTIGSITPTSATFTSASVSGSPIGINDVTNKNYVDTRITALSIALGI